MSFKLGVVAALPFEAACFTKDNIKPGPHYVVEHNLFIYYAGMGPQNAARAAHSLVESGIDGLVSWGVAGALDSRLQSGDVILPQKIIDHTGRIYTVNKCWLDALADCLGNENISVGGSIISSETIQNSPQQKAEIYQSTSAQAIDMESASVAMVAEDASKPFVTIRSIFDTASMAIPQSSSNATDQFGQVSLTRLIFELIRKPVELRLYPELITSYSKSKNSLQQIVSICGHDLCLARCL